MQNPDLSQASIGIFDSGFGGLTVMRAITELLPHENILYFGDTARLPYGNKNAETIIRYSLENVHFMAQMGIKVLIVACHTASSLALDELRKKVDLPIIGMVSPGIDQVLKVSKTKNIAILGTRATIASGVYQKELLTRDPASVITALACPLFVPLIEEGYIDHPIAEAVVRDYLGHLTDIDTLLLACTHYPLLQPLLQKQLGDQTLLIDPAHSCAKHIKELLVAQNLLNMSSSAPSYRFYVSDDPEKFKLLGKNFLGQSIEHVEAKAL